MTFFLCDGGILLGGRSVRMGGKDKAFLPLGKRTFLEILLGTFRQHFRRVSLSVSHHTSQIHLPYSSSQLEVVKDIFPHCGPMGGIYSLLTSTTAPYLFVCAVDTPLLRPQLIQLLLGHLPQALLAPADSKGRPQPLCAIYSKSCLPTLASFLEKKQLSLQKLFQYLSPPLLPPSLWKSVDPHGLSFLNINTPNDYLFAQYIWEAQNLECV